MNLPGNLAKIMTELYCPLLGLNQNYLMIELLFDFYKYNLYIQKTVKQCINDIHNCSFQGESSTLVVLLSLSTLSNAFLKLLKISGRDPLVAPQD